MSMHNPTKFFIRIEYKDRHAEEITKEVWVAWERDRRSQDEPVEVLVGGTAEHFLDLIKFERAAQGLDQGNRQLLAEHPELFKGRHLTAWDALRTISPLKSEREGLQLRGKWADLLPTIPEGQNYLWHTERGGGEPLFGWRRRYWSFLLKLAKSAPSWTIQAQPGPATGPFHWDNRRLSVQEMARLQTFPKGLKIAGSYADAQRQLGNAVPSLLAEILAREISAQLLSRPVKGRLLLAIKPSAVPPPPAHKPTAVPAAYLSLRGEHDAHPGTGRGYRAALRDASLAGDAEETLELGS
jgi:site-specific DNA-cytosine methylase